MGSSALSAASFMLQLWRMCHNRILFYWRRVSFMESGCPASSCGSQLVNRSVSWISTNFRAGSEAFHCSTTCSNSQAFWIATAAWVTMATPLDLPFFEGSAVALHQPMMFLVA
jgi:hypothetical protein